MEEVKSKRLHINFGVMKNFRCFQKLLHRVTVVMKLQECDDKFTARTKIILSHTPYT